jgi:hypothetical protein
MHHYVARAAKGTLLFRTWDEGVRLFRMLLRTFPGALGVCVMPDHVHLLLGHGEGVRRLGALLSGYARFRNAHRKTPGMSVWEPLPPPQPVTKDKERRNVRYVHLNPCRKGLVHDPLAWPLSTHRDFLGLAAGSAASRVANAARFHAYVSGDPTVDPAGTALPEVRFERFDFLAVRDAVSAVTRTVVGQGLPCDVTRLLIRAATAHRLLEPGELGVSGLAAALGLSRSWVHRQARNTPSRNAPQHDPTLAAVVRVVGDPRFAPLLPGDLLRARGWEVYRGKR